MGSQAPDPRYGDSHGMLRKIFSLQLTGSLTAPLAPLPLQEGVSCHCLWVWEALEQSGTVGSPWARNASTAAIAIHITAGKHLGPIWSGCKHSIPSAASVSLPNILASSL